MNIVRSFAAAAALSVCAAGAFAVAPANAMPVAKHGYTSSAPLVQQVAYWKKHRHCHTVKKVRWHHGHKVVKYMKVCR